MRIVVMTLGLGGLVLTAGGANCSPQSDFQCVTDDNCIAQGEGGICESNSFCSFPDEMCPTGRRWHDRASSSLSSMCVGEGMGDTDPGDSDSTSESAGSSSEGAGSSTSGDPGTGSTGSPTTDPTNATTDPTAGTTTDDGMTSSTGALATCEEIYGTAADYLLCTETEDSCAFNVTTAMAASCNDVCQGLGGTCVAAQFNEARLCTSMGDTTCDDAGNTDLICTCTRGG